MHLTMSTFYTQVSVSCHLQLVASVDLGIMEKERENGLWIFFSSFICIWWFFFFSIARSFFLFLFWNWILQSCNACFRNNGASGDSWKKLAFRTYISLQNAWPRQLTCALPSKLMSIRTLEMSIVKYWSWGTSVPNIFCFPANFDVFIISKKMRYKSENI